MFISFANSLVNQVRHCPNMYEINRANTSSSFPSSNHAKKQRLLRSWPTSISRHIPGWVPYRILRVIVSITANIGLLLFGIILIYHQYFGSTDLWGAPRDRAEQRKRDKEWKQYKKEEEYWKPTLLESPRKRRLSLPLKEREVKRESWWSWKAEEAPQQSLDQLQSPLGRLPEELRKMIYFHLVAGSRLHVQESYKRFGFVECTSNTCSGATSTCVQLLPCLEPYLNLSTKTFRRGMSTGSRICLSSYDELLMKPEIMEGNNNRRPSEMLSLAKTCRLLYTGYISSLYFLTTFAFTSLKQFQTFSTTILSHRLNTITSLQFSSEIGASFRDRLDVGWEEVEKSHWKLAWATIATMQQLRVLSVDLRMGRLSRVPETSYSGVHKWMEERIFGPMKGAQQTSVFEVTVNWVESKGFVLGEAPFQLERVWDNTAWSDITSSSI